MGALAAALVSLTLGNWQVTFQEADARLELVNASGEVHISGTLGFRFRVILIAVLTVILVSQVVK